MKYMGIDYGTRRVGVAVSDSAGEFAFAHEVLTVRSDAEAVRAVSALAAAEGIERIVVGNPRNMDGSIGPMAEAAAAFSEKLGVACGLPVDAWDERLTTASVERHLIAMDMSRGKRKQVRDKLAAQVLLQSYLDARSLSPLDDGLDGVEL